MSQSHSESYRAAGVDVTAGYRAVDLIKGHVARTTIPGVLSGVGGFGASFELDLTGCPRPVLVSGTDGVGTKLKLAFELDKHDTVGIDCVAMCVNDIVCCGARPLFFLDYIAMGKNLPERTAEIVKGVADGCVAAGCALVGGEMAEMPGFYPEGEYDMAGFAVGLANRPDMLDGSAAKAGDLLIGLPSTGVHSNGFSLIRKIIADNKFSLTDSVAELGCTLGEELLKPTAIYVRAAQALLAKKLPSGLANITGGGFFENIPRGFGPGLTAVVERAALPRLPIFELLQQAGNVPERDMFNTFNMGVGMVAIVPPEKADEAVAALAGEGLTAVSLGHLEQGGGGVRLA